MSLPKFRSSASVANNLKLSSKLKNATSVHSHVHKSAYMAAGSFHRGKAGCDKGVYLPTFGVSLESCSGVNVGVGVGPGVGVKEGHGWFSMGVRVGVEVMVVAIVGLEVGQQNGQIHTGMVTRRGIGAVGQAEVDMMVRGVGYGRYGFRDQGRD